MRAARARGIEVPILAGVIPVASFAQTKRICGLCDASIPAPLEAAFEAAGGDPEREFELGVAFAAQQCAELLIAGAPGIHFYALNKAPATRAVLGRAAGLAAVGAGARRRRDPDRQRRLGCGQMSGKSEQGAAAPGADRSRKAETAPTATA